MNITLSPIGLHSSLSLDDTVTAVFATGSFVNGYDRSDSDIDLVIVSDLQEINVDYADSRTSIHHLSTSALRYLVIGEYYCALRNVPLHNSEYVAAISKEIKRELVKREMKEIQKIHSHNGINAMVTPSDLILRYFTKRWGVIEPWRMKPLERMTSSVEARAILRAEYEPIFHELEESGFLMRSEEGYLLSPTAVLNDDHQEVSSFLQKVLSVMINSRCGGLYIRALPKIIRNARDVYFPARLSK